jgi:hypothetical protein
MSETSPTTPADRRVFLKTFCAGSLLCLGCERVQAGPPGEQPPGADTFLVDSHMSFKDVYGFAYTNGSIPLLKTLAEEQGRHRFVETLKAASAKTAAEQARKQAPPAPGNTLSAMLGDFLEGDSRFWSHVLSHTFTEKTESVVEARVTRCLWAQTFREAGAADIGYATICHPDFFSCTAFNPKIHMTRTKTLMQGDDHCNHRWVVET